VVSKITNQYGNKTVVTAPAEGEGNGINGIGQEEEARIQSTQEEFKFMAVAEASEETERVKANCILENNLQQASTSVPQNDSIVISEVSSMEQGGRIVEQHPANVEETHVLYDSLYNKLAIEVEKDNSVNHKLRETNAAKFVQDFKSLAKEADESLVKHKALELETKRLLRAVISQDIMSIVQTSSIVDTSNLQTELERRKERFENCIIKKENEYAKLWNDWTSKQVDTTKGTSVNTQFRKKSILGKPPSSSGSKLYSVAPLP
nr:hypothetical protein [Tanacetum cinerariifolium]